jgi:hypothetical protein
MISNYHNFYRSSLLEKEEETDTKKNISYEKADTGKSSADSYRILLQEIFSAIDAMTTFVSPANSKVLQTASNGKSSLGSALKNTADSHRSLLSGLATLADTIAKEMPLNTSTVNISKAYADEKSVIDKDLKDGKITQEESDTKLKELQDAADKEMEKSKDVYYQKAPEILKYYSEAIKAFSEGAKKDLDTIEKEEAKEDIDSELNFTDWLSDITDYAEAVLYGTKKAK